MRVEIPPGEMSEATIRDVFEQFHRCLEQQGEDLSEVRASGEKRYQELREVRHDLKALRTSTRVLARQSGGAKSELEAVKGKVEGITSMLELVVTAFGLHADPTGAAETKRSKPRKLAAHLSPTTIATVIAAAGGAQLLLKFVAALWPAFWQAVQTIH